MLKIKRKLHIIVILNAFPCLPEHENFKNGTKSLHFNLLDGVSITICKEVHDIKLIHNRCNKQTESRYTQLFHNLHSGVRLTRKTIRNALLYTRNQLRQKEQNQLLVY